MKLPTKEQYAASYHFVSWFQDNYKDSAVASFMSNVKPDWLMLPKWRYATSGLNRGWEQMPEGLLFWNELDDHWKSHLKRCEGDRLNEVAPAEHTLPDATAEMVMKASGILSDLFADLENEYEGDVDPDIEPTRIADITDSCGVVLGRVKNATPQAHVFMLWLTLEQGVNTLVEFLDFADEDWAENDDIDTITLTLDWASYASGLKKWRELNNKWRVYLIDNTTLSLDSQEQSLFFLVWLKSKFGEDYLTDFLDHAKEGWEDLERRLYVFSGMGVWGDSRHDWAEWSKVNTTWRNEVDND